MFPPNRTKLACAVGLALSVTHVSANDAGVELAPVTVISASGYEQNIAEAPASISVITREELEKQSYTDIVDAVKNIPGVYVTGGATFQDISIRGMSAAYTLYLVDGRPISAGRSVNTNGSDGGKQIGLPPISMIERIEVVRGPMSSLYGSEAMGGVINIITRRDSKEWHGSVSTEITHAMNDVSSDGRQVSFYAGGGLVPDLLGMRISGSYTGTDEADFVGGGDSAASTPESKRRQMGVEFFLTPDSRNRFGIGYQSSRLDNKSSPGRSVAATATGSEMRYDKDVFTLTHEGRYDNLLVNSFLQQDVSERVQDQTKKEKITTLNSQATYFWGGNVITFGGQYKIEDFTDETNGLLTSNIPGAVRNVDRWLGAVYGEIDWGIGDDFILTTGLRYNRDELFGGHLSPRVYGVYQMSPALTLKGGVSTGYVQPGLAAATAGFGRGTGGGGSPAPHPRALIIGNPDLKPESSTSAEIGFAFNEPTRGLGTSVMLFHTRYKDKISEDRFCESPGGTNNNPASWQCPFGGNNYWFLSTQMNISKAMMQGVEATFDYAFNRDLKLSASYTYTESEQLSGAFKGEPLNKQPKHMANALLDWQASPTVNLWVQGNYRGRTSDFMGRTTMSDGTPGYAFIDTGLVYQASKSVKLKAGLYNVANKKVTNESYGVVLDGRRITLGLTADF